MGIVNVFGQPGLRWIDSKIIGQSSIDGKSSGIAKTIIFQNGNGASEAAIVVSISSYNNGRRITRNRNRRIADTTKTEQYHRRGEPALYQPNQGTGVESAAKTEKADQIGTRQQVFQPIPTASAAGLSSTKPDTEIHNPKWDDDWNGPAAKECAAIMLCFWALFQWKSSGLLFHIGASSDPLWFEVSLGASNHLSNPWLMAHSLPVFFLSLECGKNQQQ